MVWHPLSLQYSERLSLISSLGAAFCRPVPDRIAYVARGMVWSSGNAQSGERATGGIKQTFLTFGTLIRDRVFVGYALSQAFVSAAMFAYISGSPFVLQDIFGVSPQMYSLFFAVNGVGIVLFSQITGRLASRTGNQIVDNGSHHCGLWRDFAVRDHLARRRIAADCPDAIPNCFCRRHGQCNDDITGDAEASGSYIRQCVRASWITAFVIRRPQVHLWAWETEQLLHLWERLSGLQNCWP